MPNFKQSSEQNLILRHFIMATVLFALFMIFVLPAASQKVSATLGETPLPDTSFFYSGEEVYQAAEAIGEEGRAFYVRQRITFDFIWPLVYAWFLFSGLRLIYRNSSIEFLAKSIPWLPILGLVADYLENALASMIMLFFPSRLAFAEKWLPICSLIKWSALILAFLLLLAGILNWGIRTARGREASHWE